jgi:hypothetical protein
MAEQSVGSPGDATFAAHQSQTGRNELAVCIDALFATPRTRPDKQDGYAPLLAPPKVA